jgi:hypothetical protein
MCSSSSVNAVPGMARMSWSTTSLRRASSVASVAGVANPSEVGAGGDEFEAARSVRHHRLEALLVDGDSLRLLPSPLGGVLEAGDAGDLPDRWGTDGDAIQDLQRLESGGFSGDDRTDAVAGDGEIFRERVQADDGVPPGRIIEEGCAPARRWGETSGRSRR